MAPPPPCDPSAVPHRADATKRPLLRQLGAAVGGVILCTPPFFYLGTTADRARLGFDRIGTGAMLGTAMGAVTGVLLGSGLYNRFVGPLVVWIVGFAVLLAVVGPGCDADPALSALQGAALGLFLGLSKWRGFLILLGLILGVNAGAAIGGSAFAGFFGLGLGACLGYVVAYVVFPLSPKATPHEPPRES